MSSELLATYSGLGVRDGEEYYKGDECLGEHMDDEWIQLVRFSHHSTLHLE